ncbi:hypothetical protein Aph02nite_83500 [Actinoplanes philippinensis]|nr:hypothetical protein Aph02nite_83500 [Actinoplanes philippinensis]
MHNQVPPDPSPPPPYGPPYTASDLPPQTYVPPQFAPFPGYPPPMPPPGPNGLAIGALVASVCGGPFLGTALGFGLGIAALVQIRRRPQQGFGLAVAALVVSGVTLVISVVIVTGVVLGVVRDRVAGIETVDATDLKRGDCISDLDDADRVYEMPVVPCTQPHRAEVYHSFQFPAGAFPGLAAVEKESEERCGTAFEPYDTADNADLEVYYLFPEDEAGWRQDRGVQCILEYPLARTTSLVK